MNRLSKILALIVFLFSFTFLLAQDSSIKRELKRMNTSINSQNAHIDSLDIQIRMLLPELQNALKANLNAKEQTDSVATLLINRINTKNTFYNLSNNSRHSITYKEIKYKNVNICYYAIGLRFCAIYENDFIEIILLNLI